MGLAISRKPGPMAELFRTNDLVLISAISAILQAERIGFFVADQHRSAVEGSLGFLPRRVMVERDRARRILTEAGLIEAAGG